MKRLVQIELFVAFYQTVGMKR